MTTDQTDKIRDRIADVLAEADGWKWVTDRDKFRSSTYRSYQSRADAVLAVLPDPAAVSAPVQPSRADVLREAAGIAESTISLFPDTMEGDAAAGAMEGLADRFRRMADEEQPAEARVVAYRSPGTRTLHCVICARQETGWQPVTDADEQAVCNFCGGRVHAVAARTLGGVVARYLPGATAAAAPFVPPAHYRRSDGVECCVHTIPVGPDSCRECRELADDEAHSGAAPPA